MVGARVTVSRTAESWIRGRLVDVWLAEYSTEFGAFDEAELQTIAVAGGVPYLPPSEPLHSTRTST